MKYRIRFAIWTIEADSAETAKRDVLDLLKKSADKLVSVEEVGNYDPKRRPVWRMFFGL